MENILKDIRLAGRTLRKTPGASLTAVLALSAGIGLSTLMFSIIWGAVLRGLPFPESDRIVAVERVRAGRDGSMPVRIHDFEEMSAAQRSFDGLAAFGGLTVNLAGAERPERYSGATMSANALSVLRVQPRLGRGFTADEARKGAPLVLLISNNLWRDLFHSDPDVIGRIIRANGEQATIVGVMPPGFRFPSTQDVWLPLREEAGAYERGQGPSYRVVGRLAGGVSIDRAIVDLGAISARLAKDWPTANEGLGVTIEPFVKSSLGNEPISMLFTMMAAVLLVLLMACVNVANLLMSRTALRLKEVGIRGALGASKARIVTQFLIEAVVMAVAAAAIGLVIAFVGTRLFTNAIASTQPPFWIVVKVDGAAVLVVMSLALIAALASGALPALQAARANINDILKDESRGSSSFRIGRISRGLVVIDIALSCALLVAAGLMIKSVVRVGNVDLGMPTASVFVGRITLPDLTYPDAVRQRHFYADLLPQLAVIPGVESASLTTGVPGLGAGSDQVSVEGVTYPENQPRPFTHVASISPGFFDTFRKRVAEGRDFTSQDGPDALQVAIVSESFARRDFGTETPLGRRIRTGPAESPNEWRTVVGVVPDLYMDGLRNEQPATMFLPFEQSASRGMTIVARTSGDPLALTARFREAVSASDPDLPLYSVNTLARGIEDQQWFYRVFGTLFMIFGFVALLLAGVGLYGVMSFSVGQRTREVGVRMALGAHRGDILTLIMRQGLLQLAIGLALGLALAMLVSRFLTVLLFDVSPRDPFIFTTIVVVLTATVTLACFIPARRATRVAPLEALRFD